MHAKRAVLLTHNALVHRAIVVVVVGAVHGPMTHGYDPRAFPAPLRPVRLLPQRERRSVSEKARVRPSLASSTSSQPVLLTCKSRSSHRNCSAIRCPP